MKKTILCTLLLAGIAAQSASAAIRTFEFTGQIDVIQLYGNETQAAYLRWDNGITIEKGDLIKGRFSFDDLGRDWAGGAPAAKDLPANSFNFTFLESNYTVDVPNPSWNHVTPAAGGAYFTLWNNAGLHPKASLDISSTSTTFPWQLGNGTTAHMVASFASDEAPYVVGFGLSSLTAVSAVPEPSTWAMLLMGMGAAAVAAGRRRRSALQ